jgi:hypothetical protein
VVVKALHVDQEDDHPLVFRQRRQGALKVNRQLPAQRMGVWRLVARAAARPDRLDLDNLRVQ